MKVFLQHTHTRTWPESQTIQYEKQASLLVEQLSSCQGVCGCVCESRPGPWVSLSLLDDSSAVSFRQSSCSLVVLGGSRTASVETRGDAPLTTLINKKNVYERR